MFEEIIETIIETIKIILRPILKIFTLFSFVGIILIIIIACFNINFYFGLFCVLSIIFITSLLLAEDK